MANITDNDENQKDANAEDNFGLPEIELTPLDKVQEPEPKKVTVAEQPQEEQTYNTEDKDDETPVFEEEEPKSNASLMITLIIVLVIAAGGFLVWKYVYKPKADKEKLEQQARIDQAKKEKEEADRIARQREEEERRKREEANAKPAIGAIETLSAKTGRYYVVVASSVDGDLVMDEAKKLSAKGKSSKIIPPYGKWKFYRLTVADEDTFAAAQTNADGLKGEFGSGTWVIRY